MAGTWRTTGSPWINRTLVRTVKDDTTGETSTNNARVVGWMSAEESDFQDDQGRPAALYQVRYMGGILGAELACRAALAPLRAPARRSCRGSALPCLPLGAAPAAARGV